MAQRFVLQSITVVRDGKRTSPEIGKAFEFTAEEIKQIDKVMPTAYRKLVDESAADTDKTEKPAGKPARGAAAGATGAADGL